MPSNICSNIGGLMVWEIVRTCVRVFQIYYISQVVLRYQVEVEGRKIVKSVSRFVDKLINV